MREDEMTQQIKRPSISHEILASRIPMGGRDLSGAEISALRELGVIVPDGSKVIRCWKDGCTTLDWMGSVHRRTKKGFKSTHILVSVPDDKKLEPAGFIIADAAAIFGTGPTVEMAWADLKNGMQTAHVPHQSDVDTEDTHCPKYWSEDQFEVLPATAALLADVEQRGGGITWSVVDGVACTEAEAG